MVEWPSISETILGWMPRPSRSVAAVWRRSWNRMIGRPRLFEKGMEQSVQEVTAVLGPAEGTGEHQSGLVPIRAEQQPGLRLPCAMSPEDLDRHRCQLHPPAGAIRLWWRHGQIPVRMPLHGPDHAQRPLLQVDVGPVQCEQLALAHAGGYRERENRFQRTIARPVQKRPRLFGSEGSHLQMPGARGVDEAGDVARHEVPPHRLLERFVEHGVDVMDRGGGQPGRQDAARTADPGAVDSAPPA